MVSLHSLYNLRFSSEGTVWSVPYYSEMLTLSCGQIALVVRTGIEPVYVDMVSTVDYPPHLTTYPCVYPYAT